MSEDYIPYGPKWEKGMMRMSKVNLITQIKAAWKPMLCPFMYWRDFCRCKYHDAESNCTIKMDIVSNKDAWCRIQVEKGIYSGL